MVSESTPLRVTWVSQDGHPDASIQQVNFNFVGPVLKELSELTTMDRDQNNPSYLLNSVSIHLLTSID
jgi:hypothetical protein